MHDDDVARDPCALNDGEFPATRHVDAQALFVYPPRDGRGEECLRRVVDPTGAGGGVGVVKGPCPGSKVGFIDEHDRAAEACHRISNIDAADDEASVGTAMRTLGPHGTEVHR